MSEEISVEPKQPEPEKRTRRKYKPRKKLTDQQWVYIRARFEMGECDVNGICETWGVSKSVTQKRITSEKWLEKKIASEIQKKAELSIIELFAEQQLPPAEVVRHIAEIIKTPKIITKVVKSLKDKDGVPVCYKSGKPITYEESVQFDSPDLKLRYIQELNKMCGMYAPPKSPVESKPDAPEIAVPVVTQLAKATEEYNGIPNP